MTHQHTYAIHPASLTYPNALAAVRESLYLFPESILLHSQLEELGLDGLLLLFHVLELLHKPTLLVLRSLKIFGQRRTASHQDLRTCFPAWRAPMSDV